MLLSNLIFPRGYFWNEIDLKCVSKRLAKKWRTTYSSIQSARPSTSTDQRLSKLDTRFSRFSRHSFGVLFKRCEKVWNVVYPGPCIDLLVLFHCLKTLLWRIKFSSPSLLLKQFWWHTSGQNIDTYGGTNQQQQVSHICCLILPQITVLLVCWSKLSLRFQGEVQLYKFALYIEFTLTNFRFWSWATSSDVQCLPFTHEQSLSHSSLI